MFDFEDNFGGRFSRCQGWFGESCIFVSFNGPQNMMCEVAFTYMIGDGRRLLFDFVIVGGFEIIGSDC